LSVFAIVNRIYSSLNTPKTGIVQGMQPLLGVNFGQKKFERVRETIAISLSSSTVYGLFICGLSLLIPGALIGLLSKETAVIAEGQVALRWMALAFPPGGLSVLVAAYFQSIGRAREALLISIGGILLVKLPVLWAASNLFSLMGIWASEAVSELILCVAALILLRNYQKKIAAIDQVAFDPR
jgi:Na+-driven multidrug efflux pump